MPAVIHPPEIRRAALQARRDGIPMDEIASLLGVSKRSIQIWAKAAGEPPMSRANHRAVAPDDKAQALRLHRQGWTTREIGELYGVRWRTVGRWIREARCSAR